MAGYTLALLARKDLDEIWTYTVGQWNEEQGERYIREIEATIKAVADELYRSKCTLSCCREWKPAVVFPCVGNRL